MTPQKVMMGVDVLTAACQRVSWTFDTFSKICVSFSGGKDSTVMTHLVAEEARRRHRKIGLLFIDWEAQYKLTIDHVEEMFALYRDVIVPYWVALPLKTVNAVSQFEPEWISWERGKENLWVRTPPEIAITDPARFPFYNYAMTFEEFVPAFGEWYGGDDPAACFVGIRTSESLNRYRTIFSDRKRSYEGRCYTTLVSDSVCNVYPIYDWSTEDIWTFHGKTGLPYNKLYDRMHQAGLSLHKMRICEPYGNEQRRGLWLFHIIEPQTWAKVVARVSGANSGALYGRERGNVLGINQVSLPPGYMWKTFAEHLLGSMPEKTSEHYKNKIAVYLRWHQVRDYPDGIPDEQPGDCGSEDRVPSWKRICKVLLRNDYWCKGLSFSPTKTAAYSHYQAMMRKRREAWNLI
jgi:predicted phosphoadenosine phosphosulfate sulfurtransferase